MLLGCWPFIPLLALPMSLQKYSCFCSRLPFWVFTLESCFFFFSIIFFVNCPIMLLKIQHSFQMGEWFIKMILAEEKRQPPFLPFIFYCFVLFHFILFQLIILSIFTFTIFLTYLFNYLLYFLFIPFILTC